VLTEGSAGQWAICLRCARRKGSSLGQAWLGLAAWLLLPLLGLAALLGLLMWLFG
jgi:hypothetical protein